MNRLVRVGGVKLAGLAREWFDAIINANHHKSQTTSPVSD